MLLSLEEESAGSALRGRPRVLTRDVVQGKKGAEGGGKELTGVETANEYPV
jgi:hypothetical protein